MAEAGGLGAPKDAGSRYLPLPSTSREVPISLEIQQAKQGVGLGELSLESC